MLIAAMAPGQPIEKDMSTDRPGFRNSAQLVGRGVVQIENGLRVFSEEAPDNRPGVAIDPNLRFGATNWLELRLYADTIVLRSPQHPNEPDRIAGASDLQAGIKVPIVAREGGNLRVTGIIKTSVPTGHGTQSAEGYQPGTELILERDLPDDFTLAGSWNVTRLKGEHFVWQHAGTLQLNRDFRPNWSTLVEIYASSPKPDGVKQVIADVAVSRSVTRNVMLDGWVGRSVRGRRSWFVAVGISVRSRILPP